jgi:hypothetical protein
MRSLFLLFNHKLTDKQKNDAYSSLGVENIIDMPDDLKALWRQVPSNLTGVENHIAPVRNWLDSNSNPGDYVLIQGDFGVSYIMVKFALQNSLIPVYSTTAREAVEVHEKDGSVKRIHKFNHVIYRQYAR